MTAFLIPVSALSALIYGVWFCHRTETFTRTVVKSCAVALLATVAAINGGPLLLVLALAFSALGDLAISRPGERAFLLGLGSFSLAHVAYILLFASLAVGWPAILPALTLALYAVSTEIWLAPFTNDMRWPVRLYVVLIAGMGIAALALPESLFLALIGVGAFITSDTLLAIQLFRLGSDSRWQVPIARGLWALYFGAQLLILWVMIG